MRLKVRRALPWPGAKSSGAGGRGTARSRVRHQSGVHRFRLKQSPCPKYSNLTLASPAARARVGAGRCGRCPARTFAGSRAAARSAPPAWFAPVLAQCGAAARRPAGHGGGRRAQSQALRCRRLTRLVGAASAGDPDARRQAEQALNSAFVAFVRDQKHDPNVGIIYVDRELRPAPPSAAAILAEAARAPNLADYVEKMGWMNPIYAQLRQALASRLYRSDAERRLLEINRERARALPGGNGRISSSTPPRARFTCTRTARWSIPCGSSRASPTGSQTPMMNAYIRFVALNPYWNSPPDDPRTRSRPRCSRKAASYLNRQGYQLMSDWSRPRRMLDPMSVDWRAVAAGRTRSAFARSRDRPIRWAR